MIPNRLARKVAMEEGFNKFGNQAIKYGIGAGIGAAGLGMASLMHVDLGTLGSGQQGDPSNNNGALGKAIPLAGLAAAFMLRKPMAAAFKSLAGAQTVGQGFLNMGAGIARGVAKTATEFERFVARPLLTGRGPYSKARDAYFPFYRGKTGFDPERLGLNPTVTRRIIAAGIGAGALASAHEIAQPKVAPPSVFYDGTGMRHVNDMGMNHTQAQSILGQNSSLNPSNSMINQMISR